MARVNAAGACEGAFAAVGRDDRAPEQDEVGARCAPVAAELFSPSYATPVTRSTDLYSMGIGYERTCVGRTTNVLSVYCVIRR